MGGDCTFLLFQLSYTGWYLVNYHCFCFNIYCDFWVSMILLLNLIKLVLPISLRMEMLNVKISGLLRVVVTIWYAEILGMKYNNYKSGLIFSYIEQFCDLLLQKSLWLYHENDFNVFWSMCRIYLNLNFCNELLYAEVTRQIFWTWS